MPVIIILARSARVSFFNVDYKRMKKKKKKKNGEKKKKKKKKSPQNPNT